MRVTLVIDLDPVAWAKYQGLGNCGTSAVREDVKSYILNDVQQSASMQDLEAEVSLG